MLDTCIGNRDDPLATIAFQFYPLRGGVLPLVGGSGTGSHCIEVEVAYFSSWKMSIIFV